MAVYTEDKNYYEGTLLNVEHDENGVGYGTVRFIGYGNEHEKKELDTKSKYEDYKCVWNNKEKHEKTLLITRLFKL